MDRSNQNKECPLQCVIIVRAELQPSEYARVSPASNDVCGDYFPLRKATIT